MDSWLRAWTAMRLANDLETCRSLLLGLAVDPARLDPVALEWARAMRFVRLDVAPIDEFERQLRKVAAA